jgi:hypothetical protein
MNMCWPHGVSVKKLQNLPSRTWGVVNPTASLIGRLEGSLLTIERNRIWSWPQAIESVMSIRISLEFAPKIVLDLILVLLFIQAIG